MKNYYSIKVDNSNPTSLSYCLIRIEDNIPDFGYDWTMTVNAGGIDYGIYLNVYVDRKEIVICNQPEGDGDDCLNDLFELFKEDEEE